MPIAEAKLEYTLCDTGDEKVAAVIVAAGNATRMGGLDKQMLLIKGVPVLARTLQKFQSAKEIGSIVVVTKPEKVNAVRLMAEEYGVTKLADVVEGGATRQESVNNGLAALNGCVETVLIHDGARPLVKTEIISAVALAAVEFGAAACGVPIYDTVKKIDENGNIVATVDRSSLVRIQTPQGFCLADYKSAVAQCANISKCTDDCSVMEQAGYKIRLIKGDESNIKVTTPADVATAERILASEEEV